MAGIATLTLNPALDVTTGTPKVAPTHKLRCTAPRFDPGGGGINVARVAKALGAEALAVFPSGGPAGAMLEQLLNAAGVPILPVPIAGMTRESFTVDETDTGDQYRFVLSGPELAAAEIDALLEALGGLPRTPAFLVASGSLPPGCDPLVYHRLSELCRAMDARLVIDTSGPGLAGCEGAGAYLLKPSLRELEDLLGRSLAEEAAQAEAARALIARGFSQVVVLSLAERGALLIGDGIELRLPAIDVPTASAVGAGDSMVAAIVVALSRGDDLAQALAYGVAAGAAALMTPGTGLARPEDVERLYAAASAGSESAQNRS